ncbi:MAG: hypothetical protein IPJ41_00520 [Phycisphaerales bacterium]|nr:hypothetical protein [Phycisphaerales bacterium]
MGTTNDTHTRMQRFLTILLGATAGGAASAQIAPIVVSPPYRVSPAEEHWHECSVGVNQGSTLADRRDVLVMASGGSYLRAVAVTWPPSDPPPAPQSIQDCNGGDVWVTPHPFDGSVWFTALQGGSEGGGQDGGGQDGGSGWPQTENCGGLIYGWKDPLDSTVDHIGRLSSEALQDKPSLAIWSDDGDPPATSWYLPRERKTGNCGSGHQFDIEISTDADDASPTWANHTVEPGGTYSGCHDEGWGALAVVLDTGRIGMVSRDEDVATGGKYNDNLPYVVYSDDGADWLPDLVDGAVNPIAIGNASITATTMKGTANDPGDTPFRVDRRNHAPTIAVRRIAGDEDEVYVAFCARSAADSTNTDIYISRSSNAETAISFPGPGDAGFFHLTDAMLGLTGAQAQADQFVPAIAVDICGGINLMFYDNRNDPDGFDGDPGVQEDWVDVYFVRITGFGTGSEQVQQWRLTPHEVRVDTLGQSGSPDFLGNYHNLTVAANGTTIYGAYIARSTSDPEAGVVTCFLHRININNCAGPLSDFNGDGVVTESDAIGSAASWSLQEPEADNNLDASIDVADLVNDVVTYSQERGQ